MDRMKGYNVVPSAQLWPCSSDGLAVRMPATHAGMRATGGQGAKHRCQALEIICAPRVDLIFQVLKAQDVIAGRIHPGFRPLDL